MGLLDDAIREHLDLKRRRGADPDEVERAEREALGPVRRNRGPGDMADSQDEVSGTEGLAYDQEGLAYDQDDDEAWREAPAADPYADPHGGFEDDEPEFDPVVPPEPADRGPIRPQSLSDPADYAPGPPHQGEEPLFDEPTEPPADEPQAPARDWSAADEAAQAPEPFPTASGSPRRPADISGQETAEYHIEDEPEPEDEEGEDMLEETPEFLQDTPDHDRLWFEQRPPRDFDFDG